MRQLYTSRTKSYHFRIIAVRSQRLLHCDELFSRISRLVRQQLAEFDGFDGARPDDVRPPLLQCRILMLSK